MVHHRWYAGAVRFEFYRFRFWFRAAGGLYFPPYHSGNILRGAFGTIFRRSDREAYARVFAPRAVSGEGPSSLRDWPRPFVFRAAHLDGRAVRVGEAFHFDVHMFDVRQPALHHFVAAFAELAREGLGPGRGLAALERVDQLDWNGEIVPRETEAPAAPLWLDLEARTQRVERLAVRFVTPTELKAAERLVERPEFAVLFTRLRDRVGALRALYGGGPLEIDFRGAGERAAAVRLTRCELQWIHAQRRSSRTGQRHPLGGFVGEADYEGDLGEFMPYLELGRWVGVGRQTVWGKGEMRLAAPSMGERGGIGEGQL
jgi:hypothetical protein